MKVLMLSALLLSGCSMNPTELHSLNNDLQLLDLNLKQMQMQQQIQQIPQYQPLFPLNH